MSLTSHLKDSKGLVARFFQERLPNTRSLVRDCNAKMRDVDTIRPVSASTAMEYSLLGMAIDYRLRYYFPATNYEELVAWHGARRVSRNGVRFYADEYGQLGVAEIGDDTSFDISLLDVWVVSNRQDLWLSPQLVQDFFRSLEDLICEYGPAGKALDSEQEATLCRYCIVLALFEQIARAGPHPDSLLFGTGMTTVADLLGAADLYWVEDLCAQSRLFFRHFEHRLGDRYVLNPTFDGSAGIGGADADLVLNSSLIDIKATINPRVTRQWIYQLLGYALLDYSDTYKLERVGLYLSRQGLLVEWGLKDLIHECSGGDQFPLHELRSDFCKVVTGLNQ